MIKTYYICDICGKEAPAPYERAYRGGGEFLPKGWQYIGGLLSDSMLCCDSCCKSIKNKIQYMKRKFSGGDIEDMEE